MPPKLSIIIPSLNAADDLPLCLASLMPGVETGLIREVILADGGSSDATIEIARDAGAKVIPASAPERAKQLIQGAAAARCDWLLFLHADTALSQDWAGAVGAHIHTHPGKAASFKLVYRTDARAGRRLAARANFRARLLGLPYGDQGLLISRRLYDEIGGFCDIPLMEDVQIVRAIGKGRLTILDATAHTSAAKYERDGWRRRSWSNAWLLTRYLLGAEPEKLAKSYT